jgi:F0F1-type ATP synthase membrane subunit b/b'
MAITAGTSWTSPIDFGVSEWLTGLTGTQIGAYNPAQSGSQTALLYDDAAKQLSQNYQQYSAVPQYVPTGTVNGVTSYGTNPAKTTAQNTLQNQATQQLVSTPSAPSNPQLSGFDMSKYPGWGITEAMADYAATGGPSSGGGSQPPSSTYNIRGTNYTGNPQDVANQVAPGNEFAQYGEQFNWDPSAYFANIDQGAAAQNDFLSKSENALKVAQDAFNAQIEADYASNMAQGSADKSKAVGTLGQNITQAEQRKQDALNSAKQLYNQLQTGYRQRFGGASSAGEASQAILGEEQQRQSGKIGRDYMNTVAQIEGQKADVENQYQAMILDLQTQKQRAVNDALQTFQTNMRSIDSDRMSTEQAKIQAKQSILLQLRDNQNAIAASDRQYQQQLQMMKEQAQLTLDTNLKALQQQQLGATTAGQTALNNYKAGTQNITSQTGMSGQPKSVNTLSSQPQDISTAVGYINPYTGVKDPLNWRNM